MTTRSERPIRAPTPTCVRPAMRASACRSWRPWRADVRWSPAGPPRSRRWRDAALFVGEDDTEGLARALLNLNDNTLRVNYIQFEFNEMNVISRTFFLDFMRHLPGYRFFRLLPEGAVSLDTYSPRFMEIFAYQNVVCVRSGLDASWIAGASASSVSTGPVWL